MKRRSALVTRWRAVPLRVQLAALAVAMVTLALVLSAVATHVVLERSLVDRADTELVTQGRGFADRPPPRRIIEDGAALPSRFFVQRFASDGTSFDPQVDPRLERDDYPDLPDPATDDITYNEPFTISAADGSPPWRVVFFEGSDGGTVAVAVDLTDVTETLERLRWIELAIAVTVLVAVAAISSWLVARSLRPLIRVERTAEAIAGGDLGARVPMDADPRTEVGALASSLNTMLGHIEKAVDDREREAVRAGEEARRAEESERRMRRFVADASHELRTPLTSIRGFAELYAQGAATDEATTDRFMARIRQEADRMGILVEDLLLLARLDQERPLRRDPVDLRTLVRDAVVDARATQPDRPVAEPAAGPPVIVEGDEARLRQVIANLVGNALVHTPPEAELRVDVRAEGDEGVLIVSDDGPGLDEESAAHAFERFYRADEARSRQDGGSGLGLAIVSALVAGHGGRVSLDTAPGEGATFTVRIPLAR
ncbi:MULTISPECIES: sensor histidine kinase [Mumia]|uniref:sensor histidine kinase n=1 Tax=Mumia TaxID=1546255 RepID=UPI00141E0BFB|nr:MULTISPECIES: ATP-binding protein [unclassified Mumia]QMW66823.1 HAMP domain-containing protein [Mumia sp. ZJ1417]